MEISDRVLLTSDHGVAIVIVTSTISTAAHTDHPTGLRHLAVTFRNETNPESTDCTWSYTFLKAGAILLVRVPATMMTSACLGEALNTMPYLSMSYLGAAMCIISTAQQARPNVSGQREPCKEGRRSLQVLT